MTDGGTVNAEFLRTLIASNAIWGAFTLLVTGLGTIAALLWRRRVRKADKALDDAICLHCHACRRPLVTHAPGHFVLRHVVASQLCVDCALALHARRQINNEENAQ